MSDSNPATILEFQDRFDSEAACEAYLFQWRWPDGFRCPRCGCQEATRLRTRRQLQCRGCRHQTSVTAGTALHKTKLPLRVWSWAIFLVARHKKSISALQLMADLGIGSYRTAWLLLHKIRSCFDESPDYPLVGLVEVDEAWVGGAEKGVMQGRAASRKGIVVAGVEVTSRGRLGSARMQVIPKVKARSLVPFVVDEINPDATVATDGWPS